ncbi:MAG: hypothetical protein JWL73_1561 [Actinomycetia bacterium]|nr:hypothetical protein [Actinomycetes bacterium]
MTNDDERIALFLDYENLAIGAREALAGAAFDFGPVADALADRGRVVVRRAYADWSNFEDDRRMLTRHNIELIEIPQKMGAVRKNAADIKMAVDAIELSFERDYITTFVLGTGDSDFSPLVQKLRELNKQVIGIGVEASTSKLLPPACDEFLFYERLEGVEIPEGGVVTRTPSSRGRRSAPKRPTTPDAPIVPEVDLTVDEPIDVDGAARAEPNEADLAQLVTRTLAGLERGARGAIRASTLKRALLRKDPTFSEVDYGFRSFGELLRHLAAQDVVVLTDGSAPGDPEVRVSEGSGGEEQAFELLRDSVAKLETKTNKPALTGMKTQMRKSQPDFTEKRFGYGGFLQFAKAARAKGYIDMDWDEAADNYVLHVPPADAPAPSAV